MKRSIAYILVCFCSVLSIHAMDYETARQEALYLTDKMAYELNLNDQQYNDAYEINLDYLLSLTTADDIQGAYLDYRCTDFRHILYDWQWSMFCAADYFLRPVMWLGGRWFYPIYTIYDRHHFFFGHPAVYISYHGGHGHFHYHDGFYGNRRPVWNEGMRGRDMGAVRHQAGRNGVRSNYVQGRGMNFRSNGEGRHEMQRNSQGANMRGAQRERGGERSHGNSFDGSSTRSTIEGAYRSRGGRENNMGNRSSRPSKEGSVSGSHEFSQKEGTRGGRNSISGTPRTGSSTRSNSMGNSRQPSGSSNGFSRGNSTRSSGFSGGNHGGSSFSGGSHGGGSHGGGFSGGNRGGGSHGGGRGHR